MPTSIIPGLILALPGVLAAFFGLYLVTLAAASAVGRRPELHAVHAPRSKLTVIVPAHDEELLVGRCVESLLSQSYPRELFHVVVIADNCSDGTQSVARQAGAEVMVRQEPDLVGKGHALRWAMDRVLSRPEAVDAMVVVDADSVADRQLLAALAAELEAGHVVVQADYSLLEEAAPGRSEMAEVGFLLFHRVRFRGRARLGMPASLVGNGMLFSRRVLEDHPWSAFTGAEDLEYSIQLRLAGIRPRFAAMGRLAGPGAASRGGALTQRLRWEGGRFHVLRTQLLRLILESFRRRDPGLLDAAIDLATPPLSLLSLGVLAGLAVTTLAVIAGIASWWSAISWAAALLSIPAFVFIGLIAAGAPDKAWRVLVRAPGFVAWKLVAYSRLLRGHDVRRWDRTDRVVS